MTAYRAKAYIYLLVAAIIWGVAGPVIKFTLGELPPFPFLIYRFGISTVVSLVVISKTGYKIPNIRQNLLFILLFAFLTSTVSLSLFFVALEKTTVLDMALISTFGPMMVVVAGAIFLHERVTHREKIGMAIILSGVTLTIFEPLIQNGQTALKLSGNFMLIIVLFIGTIGAIMIKELVRRRISPLVLIHTSFIVGFITIIPTTYIFGDLGSAFADIRNIGIQYHLGVFYMAIVSGNFAYWLWVRAQKSIEIGQAALFSYLQPVFAAPLAVVWLGEKITPVFMVGAAVIAVGVVIAEHITLTRPASNRR